MENSVLLNKPDNLTLVEYFDKLDIFDKRNLLNELKAAKMQIDSSFKSFLPYLVLVLVSSILGVSVLSNIYSYIYFGSISGIMLFFAIKNLKKSFNFKVVIDFLTKKI